MKLLRDSYYFTEMTCIDLVIVVGLETTTETTKVLRVDMEVGFCNNTPKCFERCRI